MITFLIYIRFFKFLLIANAPVAIKTDVVVVVVAIAAEIGAVVVVEAVVGIGVGVVVEVELVGMQPIAIQL